MTNTRRIVLYLFLGALLLRVLAFSFVWHTQGLDGLWMSDDNIYSSQAEHLLEGKGFSYVGTIGQTENVTREVISDYRAPIYPLLMATSLGLTGGYLLLVSLLLVMGSLIPPLTFYLGQTLGVRDRNSILLAALLTVVEPLLLVFSFMLYTDVLFTSLFLIGFICFVLFFRTRSVLYASLAGGIWGIATLLRPVSMIYLPFILALVALWLWKEKKAVTPYLKGGAAAIAVFILILSPWLVRNYIHFGRLSVSSEGIVSLYTIWGASFYSLKDNIPFYQGERTAEHLFNVQHNLPDDYFYNPDPKLVVAAAPALFKENLALIPKIEGIVVFTFFTQDNSAYFLQRFGLLPPRPSNFSVTGLLSQKGLSALPEIFGFIKSAGFIPLLGRLFWILVFILSLVGSWTWWKAGQKFESLFMWATILYFLAVSSVVALGMEARFRTPIVPLLLLLASAGFLTVWRIARDKLSHLVQNK